MFSVIFEVQPKTEQFDTYLGIAKMLRPELEQVDGFVDNIRYRSLTRQGWILSLSTWRDEKAVVRWRTTVRHHEAQERGRNEIFSDYHLRVGQVTKDTKIPTGYTLQEQRLDETEVGEATTVVLIDGKQGVPTRMDGADGLVSWDVFDAVLTPGDMILLTSWRDHVRAEAFESKVSLTNGTRLRRVRIIRDYGMQDRREAPQYYPYVPTRS